MPLRFDRDVREFYDTTDAAIRLGISVRGVNALAVRHGIGIQEQRGAKHPRYFSADDLDRLDAIRQRSRDPQTGRFVSRRVAVPA